MSAQALQRVAVRMLYDKPFLDSVYENAIAATADCDLTDEEREWLRAPDQRAWRVDPLRRSRSLAALVEEFAVSVAVFVRSAPGATARLDSFFSSEHFHRGMQEGASLARLFADWFAGQLPAPQHELLRLEASLARVRRERDAGRMSSVESGAVVLANAVEVLDLTEGTAAAFSAVLGALRQGSIAERALDRNLDVPIFSPGAGREGVLVDGRSDDPRLELLSVELAQVLAIVSKPTKMRDFVVEAARHGAEEDDCRSILASFAADGLVDQT